MITLLTLTLEDVKIIKAWPPYPPEISKLDFAIRDGGWLDTKKDADFLSVYTNKILIGFIGLYEINENNGEFLIAMHTDYIGKGYGSSAMKMAIQHYFNKYRLAKIKLRVRKTNHVARHVYKKIGFKDCDESIRNIQGKLVEFWDMYIDTII